MESVTSKVLDAVDIQILKLLQGEEKISNIDISKRINLSPPAVHLRIKRLENDGFIKRQVAILNQEKLGFDLLCFVFINTHIHQADQLNALEEALRTMPEVLECHCLTGEYDYLLKVVCRDRKELESFIREINKIGVTTIQTSLVLREIKDSTLLPIM